MSSNDVEQDSSVGQHSKTTNEPGLARTLTLTYTRAPSDTIKRSLVHKLGSDFNWKSKWMLLSDKDLWFRSDENSSSAADNISLHEISSIRPSRAFGRDLTPDPSDRDQAQEEVSTTSPLFSDSDKTWLRSLGSSKLLSKVPPENLRSLKSTSARDFPVEGSFHHCCFDIVTTADGLHSGRIYTVRMTSTRDCEEWVLLLNKESARRRKEHEHQTRFEKLRSSVREFYHSPVTQGIVGLAIVGNFAAVATQAQVEPMAIGDPAKASKVYEDLDLYFTLFFAAELGVNLFGNWFWAFVNDKYSMFDAVVVAMSVASLLLDFVQGISILRMLRAFRLLRVIKRFDSLLRITNAIFQSTIPVLNALLILQIVTAIYAVMGVVLFAEANPDMFGTFGRSMYTMFELLAWEWTGPSVFGEVDGELWPDATLIVFLVSFMVIGSWTLLQVVVAVLLDNFIAATEGHKLARQVEARAANRKPRGAIDPLLESLSRDIDTERELEGTLTLIWNPIDEDGAGRASQEQIRAGLLRLNLAPRIRLSDDDFAALTAGYGLCDEERRVSRHAFSRIVTNQLRVFLQRKVSEAAAMTHLHSEREAVLQGLKQVLMTQNSAWQSPPDVEHLSPRSPARMQTLWEHSGADDSSDDASRKPWARRTLDHGRASTAGAPQDPEDRIDRLLEMTSATHERMAALEASHTQRLGALEAAQQQLSASVAAKFDAVMAALRTSPPCAAPPPAPPGLGPLNRAPRSASEPPSLSASLHPPGRPVQVPLSSPSATPHWQAPDLDRKASDASLSPAPIPATVVATIVTCPAPPAIAARSQPLEAQARCPTLVFDGKVRDYLF